MTTNGKILLLFLILLLGLILCSFLGGRGCNREGFSSNDVTAVKTDTGIMLTFPDGTTKTLKMTSETSYSANGYTATIASDGTISVSTPSGDTYVTEGFVEEPVDSSTNNTSNTSNSTSSSSSSSSSSDPYYDDSVETDAVNTSYSTSSPPTSTSSSNQGTYNHYDGSYSTTYYGPYGGTATVTNIEDKGKLVSVNNNGSIKLYYIPNSGSTGKSNDSTDTSTATIVTDGNGKAAVKITDANGNTTVYTISYNQNQSVDNTMNQYDSSSGSGTDYNNAYVYTGPNGAAATGPNGNTAVAATGPNGNTYVGTNYDSSDYYSSLPPGISANQIPAGQEDLYILKSQVVPPVCPKCPDPILRSNDSTDVTKCPPCPPCARCPEPAFDCKKVPNYNAFNPDYMPVPVLSDFSGFGM